jgi:formylglycine-generating enzyme required for sulfatase activity
MKTIGSLGVTAFVLSYFAVSTAADTFGSAANTFEIEFVTIGNPGNAADTFGNVNPAGKVEYVYRIGKFEISRDMVTKANADGNLGIGLNPMNFVTGGPRPAMPATDIWWHGAARFVNWLNVSRSYQPAYKFSTQPGDAGYYENSGFGLWEPGDRGFDPANPLRNRLAHYFLPSVDEWHKAAYYDPRANGGTGGYWQYPTGSNVEPKSVASGTAAGTAVYGQDYFEGPGDVTQAGGLSPYGVMGLGGNVMEWNETEVDLVNDSTHSFHVLRGTNWDAWPDWMIASWRYNFKDGIPLMGNIHGFGFRVASVQAPEPPGDFNQDGTIDAADYVVWRKGLGRTYSQADYDPWRSHFGRTAANGSSVNRSATSPAVPEPWGLVLVALSCAWLAAACRCSLRNSYGVK